MGKVAEKGDSQVFVVALQAMPEMPRRAQEVQYWHDRTR